MSIATDSTRTDSARDREPLSDDNAPISADPGGSTDTAIIMVILALAGIACFSSGPDPNAALAAPTTITEYAGSARNLLHKWAQASLLSHEQFAACLQVSLCGCLH